MTGKIYPAEAFHMTTSDPFFSIPEDSEWNACIGKQGDEENYADGYIEAAQELASAIIDKGMYEKRDTLVLPILYNARHAIELTLKLVIRVLVKCGILPHGHKPDHDIASHFRFLEDKAIPDERFRALLSELKSYIDSLDRIDKDGQELRYHTDRDGKKSMDQKALANIEVIRYSLKQLSSHLQKIKYRSYVLSDEWATGTWTKQCSRSDLQEIANMMPERSNWDSEDYTVAREKIKKRFALSNNKVSDALDKIQASRELAGLLGITSDLVHLSDEKACLLLKMWKDLHLPRETSHLGVDYFNRDFEKIRERREQEALIVSKILEELSEDEIADAEAIYYLCRDGVYPEFYEECLERKKKEFQANGDLRQEVLNLMNKTNFERFFKSGMRALGRLNFGLQAES